MLRKAETCQSIGIVKVRSIEEVRVVEVSMSIHTCIVLRWKRTREKPFQLLGKVLRAVKPLVGAKEAPLQEVA